MGSLDTINALNAQEKGRVRMLQIHAAAGLFSAAMMAQSQTDMEMVICLCKGLGITNEELVEVIGASMTDCVKGLGPGSRRG